MSPSKSQLFFIFAAAGLVASQSISSLGLSQQCSDAITGSFGNSELGSCLNFVGALNIFTTTANQSIVPPVNTWLQGVCGAQPCSNATLMQAAQNITQGCQSDLSNIGISQEEAMSIVNTALPFYPTVRKVACLQDNNDPNRSLCVNELLTDLQNAIGTLSLDNIISIAQQAVKGESLPNVPKNVTCNDCTQAAWAIISNDIPAAAQDTTITGVISDQCGADFVNGTQPSNIVESDGSGTSAGAAMATRVNLGGFVGLAGVPLVALFAGSALLL